MRWLVVPVVLVAACSSRATQTPWPESAGKVVVEDWRDDGGESLAPQDRRASALESRADKARSTEARAEPARSDDKLDTPPTAPGGDDAAVPPTTDTGAQPIEGSVKILDIDDVTIDVE